MDDHKPYQAYINMIKYVYRKDAFLWVDLSETSEAPRCPLTIPEDGEETFNVTIP